MSKRNVRGDKVRRRTRPTSQERRVVQVFQPEPETRPATQGPLFGCNIFNLNIFIFNVYVDIL